MHFTNAHDQLKLYVDLFTYVVRIFVLLNTVGLRLNSAVTGCGLTVVMTTAFNLPCNYCAIMK